MVAVYWFRSRLSDRANSCCPLERNFFDAGLCMSDYYLPNDPDDVRDTILGV